MLGHDKNASPYFVLGLSAGASQDEIRSAYKRLAKLYHPDRYDPRTQPKSHKHANERMQRLNQAYDLIGEPEKRSQYDAIRMNFYGRGYHSAQDDPHPRGHPAPNQGPLKPSWSGPSASETIVAITTLYLLASIVVILTLDGLLIWMPLVIPAIFIVAFLASQREPLDAFRE